MLFLAFHGFLRSSAVSWCVSGPPPGGSVKKRRRVRGAERRTDRWVNPEGVRNLLLALPLIRLDKL